MTFRPLTPRLSGRSQEDTRDGLIEIQQAYNGVCEDTDFITYFTDLGCKNILVESEDTPNDHFYINDAENNVVKKNKLLIHLNKFNIVKKNTIATIFFLKLPDIYNSLY